MHLYNLSSQRMNQCGCTVNTYTTSHLCISFLCLFLLITVEKLERFTCIFIIYVCLQKHCLLLICLSSIAYVFDHISDVNAKDLLTGVYQLVVIPFGSTQDLTLLVRRAQYPLHEFHDSIHLIRFVYFVTEYLNTPYQTVSGRH